MLLEDNLSPWRLEELIGATKLLLDFTELLLDSSLALRMTDEELLDFAELLLDSSLALRMTDEELLDFTELLLGTLDDDDLAFSLLLELDEELDPSWLSPLRMTEDDDSTPGSSFGPVEDEESSPQAANNKAAAPIATRNFFINPPVNPK